MADDGLLRQDAGKELRLRMARCGSVGASSIQWFDEWVATRDPAIKQRILDYNEDDCVAMRVVLDRMRRMSVRTEAD